MTMSFVAGFGSPLDPARTNAVRQTRWELLSATSVSRRHWTDAATSPADDPTRMDGGADRTYIPGSPPGVIGAAVIRAARRSGGLTRRRLARMLAVSHETVLTWEDGAAPLYCIPYGQLRALAEALAEVGARVGWELDELLIASQCDLLVTGMLRGFEDYAEVPPVDGEDSEGWAACGLLRWALTGAAPQRYRPYASSNPLLTESDAKLFMAIVRDLRAGSHGLDLVGYGTALMALAR